MKKKNVWKIIAICFIIIFAVIIIGGLFRAYHFRESLTKATTEEITNAKNVAFTDLTNKGIDTNQFSYKVSDVIRPIDKKGVIEVSVYNDSTRYSYLIDKDTMNIVMNSVTEFHDDINHSKDLDRGPPGFFH